MKRYKVIDLLEEVISGEWGQEPSGENDVKVLRTTNFTNEGRLDLNKEVVRRTIDKKKIGKKKLQYGDIIIEKSGGSPDQPVGRVVYFDIDDNDIYLCNNFTSILRPHSKMVENKYLLYFLYYQHKTKKVLKYQNKTTGIINLKLDNYLKRTDIVLPSRKIQQRIVQLLDKSYELIEKRKAQIEALDQLAQSVFLEMFGDPVKNPKNWPVGIIGDITFKTQYGTSKKASENKGRYPILRMGNITYNGFLDFNDMKYIDLNDLEAEKYLVHKGDLLFNRTNSKELVGKTAVYREDKPMAYAGYLVKLLPNEKANSEFISGYLNSKYGKAVLYSRAKNIVGMANINAEELKRIKIYIPPRDLQDKFASIVSNILQKRELLFKGLRLLEENYNSLLQRSFKGELFTDKKISNP